MRLVRQAPTTGSAVSDLLEAIAPAVTEQAEEAHEWVCDLVMGTDSLPCENVAEWFGAMVCGCVTAACTEHKEQFDVETLGKAFLGVIGYVCAEHGQTLHALPLCIWSPL